jgi:hypothetical protein
MLEGGKAEEVGRASRMAQKVRRRRETAPSNVLSVVSALYRTSPKSLHLYDANI